MRIAVAGAGGTVGHHLVRRTQAAGHEVVRLGRRDGVDVRTGAGLDDALAGVEAVVDVTNAGTTDQHEATAFFTNVARTLQRAAATAGVRHVVTLSIVGIDKVPFGYYAAKLVHEEQALTGTVPATVVRATQFHEFPAQLLAATPPGGTADIPAMTVQTIAASTVATRLLDLAVGSPQRRARDIGGPDTADLVDLARSFVARHGPTITVRADSTSTAAMPTDALMPDENSDLLGPTFADWLDSPDAIDLRR